MSRQISKQIRGFFFLFKNQSYLFLLNIIKSLIILILFTVSSFTWILISSCLSPNSQILFGWLMRENNHNLISLIITWKHFIFPHRPFNILIKYRWNFNFIWCLREGKTILIFNLSILCKSLRIITYFYVSVGLVFIVILCF